MEIFSKTFPFLKICLVIGIYVILRIYIYDQSRTAEFWDPIPVGTIIENEPRNYSICYRENENSIIFFHLTYKSKKWHPLEMCAFKSAAFLNSNSTVCVLTITEMDADSSLNQLPNLEFGRLDVPFLVKNTPLDYWYKNFVAQKRRVKPEEMSDALRFAYLSKYGGAYMDTDVISLRSIEELRNVIGWEDRYHVNGAVMKFSKGHPFVELALDSFTKYFVPGKWGSVGPNMISSLHKSGKAGWSTYTVLDRYAFYPIRPGEYELPFNVSAIDKVKLMVNGSYTLHLWHAMLADMWNVGVDSKWNGSFVGELFRSVCL